MSLAIGGRASRRPQADLPGLIGVVAGKIVVVAVSCRSSSSCRPGRSRNRDLISERSYALKGRREAAFSFAGSDCGKLRRRNVLKLEHSGRIG
jgi:hypothetical protein